MSEEDECIYLRVADDLSTRIRCGRLNPGDALPPIRELAAEHSCSRRTVTQALKVLESGDLIYRIPGHGYYVIPESAEPDPRIYRRIMADLRDQIAAGKLKPGDQLPSVGALTVIYGCERKTATTALMRMETDGLVFRVASHGYLVTGEDGSTDNPSLYLQIAGDLRAQVKDASLKPGDPSPSITALCAGYECSRRTVTKAMKLLEKDGLLYRVPGLGYFVADPQ